MTRPRICLISTWKHNVGDDFVREGIVWLLEKVMGKLEICIVHKHFPASVRGGWLRSLDAGTRGLNKHPSARLLLSGLADALPLNARTDGLLSSDLVVQCGAPVYWKNKASSCAQTEWFYPLIERRWKSMRERVPLLNLGAGSCQALNSDGSEVSGDDACRAFIREFTTAARLTTVRDSLAQQIVRQCGCDAPLLPCPSIFAPQAAGVAVTNRGYVALNYMRAGGHYDLGNLGEAAREAWERRFVEMALGLSKSHACRLICHDEGEYESARQLLPGMPCDRVTTSREALDAYAGCTFAIVNRVHGAVVAAAMGKRVVLIGNDSRVMTADLVPGIRTLPVTAAQEEFDLAVRELQPTPSNDQAGQFLAKAEEDYLALLKAALNL